MILHIKPLRKNISRGYLWVAKRWHQFICFTMRTKTKKCAQEILGQMRFMLLYLRVPKPSFLYLFPSLFNTLVPKIAKKKKTLLCLYLSLWVYITELKLLRSEIEQCWKPGLSAHVCVFSSSSLIMTSDPMSTETCLFKIPCISGGCVIIDSCWVLTGKWKDVKLKSIHFLI